MTYTPTTFDEMFAPEGGARDACRAFVERLDAISIEELRNRQIAAELHLSNMGITFNVYGHEAGVEKVWPFDVLPRIIGADDWRHIETGLRQRVTALNLFIDDVYNERRSFVTASCRSTCFRRLRPIGRNSKGSAQRTRPGATSVASTLSATATARSTCWRTTSVARRASRTFSRTARS